jgi:uncharacterized protein (DUF885 family)
VCLNYVFGLLAITLAFGPREITWKGEETMPLPRARAEARVDSAGRDYYRGKFALYPAWATSKGVHDFDHSLSTFSPRSIGAFERRVDRIRRSLATFNHDSLSIPAWIDLQALQADMETQTFLLNEINLWRRSPLLYSDACIEGVYSLVLRSDRADRDENLNARLRAIPDVTNQARDNLTEPIKLHCEVAAAGIRDFVPFLKDLGSGEAGIALDPSALSRAEAALDRFAAYLDSLALTADPDFALGYDNLTRLLQVRHLINDPLEALEGYAERILEEAEAERQSLTDVTPVPETDPSRAEALTLEDILAYYYAEAESAEAFLRRKDLVTLPEGAEIRIVPTPRFLRGLVPGYAYEPPGPFDTKQVGLFYVPLPTDLDAEAKYDYQRSIAGRTIRGVVVHEVYPGHHLQIVIANRNPSYIRRLQEDLFTMEGWAFYCEEMMGEAGYRGPGWRRDVLDGIVFRAARVVVDIKLQTGEFSLDDAVDFMVNHTGASRGFVMKEVRRYAVRPLQAMTYLVGKREILALRSEFEKLKGDEHSLKDFHDTLLSCGSVPLFLLRTCVMSEAMDRD